MGSVNWHMAGNKETDMDQIKIGKFIAEMRKEQSLTQIDLAEKLGISNKTISKWECGKGMPDYAVMEGLCEALKINVNELLSGERLPSKEYNKKAEENMMSLIQESSINNKREKRNIILMILGITAVLFAVMGMMVMSGGLASIQNFLDMPTLTYMILIFILVLALGGMLKDFVKAIPTAIKMNYAQNIQQVRKSMAAVKTAIITVNIAGVLSFLIGLINSLRAWTFSGYEVELLLIWLMVAGLSIVYSLVFTLILLPIYMRLKNK